jgi:hypothetical protein
MADLYQAHFEATPPADLSLAVMDSATRLDGAVLGNEARIGPWMEGVQWNGARLTGIDWSAVQTLGDEHGVSGNMALSRRIYYPDGNKVQQFAERAYRQLTMALRDQGINDHADRYAYRAQLCHRRVLRLERHYLRYLGSLFLDLISGYGYQPVRSFITYALVILGFAAAFFAIGSGVLGISGHRVINAPVSALIFSITSFHGRGFFPGGGLALDDPITILAAIEAIMGLFIEITFIATFTQRFFAR